MGNQQLQLQRSCALFRFAVRRGETNPVAPSSGRVTALGQSWSIRATVRSSAAFLALAFCAATLHAQSLSNQVRLQNSTFDYRVLSYQPTAAGFVAQANAEGGQRYSYGGDYQFSSAVPIYARAVDLNVTATYQSLPRPNSAAALDMALNDQGAAGFLYLGDHSVSDSLLANYSGYDTYAYRELPLAVTVGDFSTHVNAQGAQGFAFLGNVGLATCGGGFAFSSLFIQNTAITETFSYETRDSPASVAAFLTQAGALGLLGCRYNGDILFPAQSTTSTSLYVKTNARSDRFSYDALNITSTAPDFLAQANAMGARKYRYYGNMGFGSPVRHFSAIYISLSDYHV